VFGIGVNPQSLIAERNFYPLKYLEPIAIAQKTADILKLQKRCDLIICLSHQGTHLGDIELAKATKNIDIIIGAHTHKILTDYYVQNVEGDSVFLGRIKMTFSQ
jgi:5'-nucleotidase